MSSPNGLRVGVLLISPFQLLDASPVDLFSMLTKDYLSACGFPGPLIALGIPVSIYYISESGPGTLAATAASASIQVTSSLDEETVQPGKLDVLLTPGPDPNLVPSEKVKAFVRSHADGGTTDFLFVCTGIFVAGHAGIIDNKKVTGPRGLLPKLKSMFPKTIWLEKRWACDGRIWTSGMPLAAALFRFHLCKFIPIPSPSPSSIYSHRLGGITNGQDMVAAYLHDLHEHTVTIPKELADLVCAMADVGGRGQDYDNTSAGETAFWLWLIIKSWIRGWRGRGQKTEAAASTVAPGTTTGAPAMTETVSS